MTRDDIAHVEIDAAGRLHVVPRTQAFPYIWREAMEVAWDPERNSLRSPKPREWSYAQWYVQLLEAARQQGVHLAPTASTAWGNVDEDQRAGFLQQEADWLARRPGGTERS